MDNDKLKKIFSKNLNYYMDAKGVNQTDLCNRLDIPKMTMNNWVNANTYPRPDKIQLLADFFNIRRSDLTEEKRATNIYTASEESIRIPILGEIACGEPIYVSENFSGYRTDSQESIPSGNVYYLKAKGNSMSPSIPEGAYVLIREQSEVENGEIAAVLINDENEATLKRVRKNEDAFMLIPDNRDYDPIIINKNNPCRILGKAIRYTFDL